MGLSEAEKIEAEICNQISAVLNQKQTKAIFFNAPPRAGKDTAGKEIVALLNVSPINNFMALPLKFATPLKNAAHALFGIPKRDPDMFENSKEEPSEHLHGFTPRKVYQRLSEAFAKPEFGDDFFGQIFLKHIKETETLLVGEKHQFVVVCTDSGFVGEIMPTIDYLGKENVLIVHIMRDGCHYRDDTRSYISIEGVKSIMIENNAELVDFKLAVIEQVIEWLRA